MWGRRKPPPLLSPGRRIIIKHNDEEAVITWHEYNRGVGLWFLDAVGLDGKKYKGLMRHEIRPVGRGELRPPPRSVVAVPFVINEEP